MKNKKESLLFILFLTLLLSTTIGLISESIAEHGGAHREFVDSRYGHNRHYPMHGESFGALPRDHRVVVHHGERFFFSGGVWYRAAGPRFVVVAPPIGVVIPFLPPYYVTIWVGGSPFYYANDVYYAPAPGGYVVVPPPQGVVSQTPPPGTPPPATGNQPGEQVFIYPRQGQSEAQQGKDRYECHLWAVNQTGFDPTGPSAYGADEQKRADYRRAMSACLEGRGYTVK